MHVGRRPAEASDTGVRDFYNRLLRCLKRREVREGNWRLLECAPAWDGNPTWENFVAFVWETDERERLLVTVNYGPTQGQCYVRLPLPDLSGSTLMLGDLMSPVLYERDGNDLASRGLYLDMPAWGFHVFEVVPE